MLRIAEGLMQYGCTVRQLSIATDKHPWLPEKIDPAFLHATKADAIYVNTNVRWLPAFLSLFKSSSYNVDRFYSLSFEARLIETLAAQEFDIIQLESLYMAPYIPAIRRMSKGKIVLRAHNAESDIWKKYADEESDILKRKWFRDLAEKLARYERNTLKIVDAVVPITQQDAVRFEEFGNKKPTHVSTFAMESPVRIAAKPVIPNTVFHIGAMDWKPNADGVQWLTDKVWPLVLKKIPSAQLHLAGKGMREDLTFSVPNITIHGEVASAKEFMQTYRVMAVPLFSGGGVKIKVVEGMFLGKPIVTTNSGAEGINYTEGQELFIRETPEAFAEALCDLLQNESLADHLGKNAEKSAQENHKLSRVTEKLCDFYRTIIAK